jgi:hypothetical protein
MTHELQDLQSELIGRAMARDVAAQDIYPTTSAVQEALRYLNLTPEQALSDDASFRRVMSRLNSPGNEQAAVTALRYLMRKL